MTYQLITFDLDGTLVDTAGEIAEAANRTIVELGFARRPVDEITNLIGRGTRELMVSLMAAISREPFSRQFDEHDALRRCQQLGPSLTIYSRGQHLVHPLAVQVNHLEAPAVPFHRVGGLRQTAQQQHHHAG